MRFTGFTIPLSLLALVLGATVFGIIMLGPTGVFAGPILAIFGWFYFFPILLLVLVASFVIEHPAFRGRGAYAFVAIGGFVGGLLMALLGVKEIGQVARWTLAYGVGGAASGAITAGLIAWLYRWAK
jgi:hypothetical protein